MKRALIAGLIMALLTVAMAAPAMAASEQALIEAESWSLLLKNWRVGPGGATLTALGRNDGDGDVAVTLLAAEVNDQSAGFFRGWGSDAFDLPAGQETEVEIVLESDDPDETPERLALRFAADGRVSSRLEVDLTGPDNGVSAASFEAGALEPQLVDPVIDMPEDAESCRRTLTDTLSAQEREGLTDAHALICLRTDGEEGERLTQLCTVDAAVDEAGNVTADYSGLVLALADDPDFLVETVEASGAAGMTATLNALARSGAGLNGTAGSVSLSGMAIFYATMSFDLRSSEAGAAAVDVVVSSQEVGGSYAVMPCALFETAQTSLVVWQPVRDVQRIYLKAVGSASEEYAIEGPMRFALRPAASLGEIVYCFDYFYGDNSDVIRPPLKLE